VSSPASPRTVVVGSGPAGMACAAALVARGIRPLVLDAGRELEPARVEAVERAVAGGSVDPAFVRALEEAFPVDVDALPLKPAFGSLFPYAEQERESGVRLGEGVGVVPSLARGGLSTVWGASILPHRERDLEAWPAAARDLAEAYRGVFAQMPLAGEEDALADEFPLYGDPQRLEPTAQVAALLARLRGAEGDLRAQGCLAGRARLALYAGTHASACRLAGVCMLGCPYGSIWSAAATLSELLAADALDYRPGIVIERVEERGGSVRLRAGEETVDADRVFLAAGALTSTRLVLASQERHGSAVTLRDSAYFTLPLLTRTRAGKVGRGMAGNTLAQVYLELDPPAGTRGSVHVQVYGYNDLMLRAAAARARLPEATAQRLLQPLLGRLLYAQGYLHSDDSPALRAELVREDGRDILSLTPGEGSSRTAVGAVVRRLAELRPLTGLRPLASQLQVWPQGKGFHVGGSLPMRDRPGPLESDVLGRPHGFERVHVVDASVLPSLPATTITLAVMATAYRIGRDA